MLLGFMIYIFLKRAPQMCPRRPVGCKHSAPIRTQIGLARLALLEPLQLSHNLGLWPDALQTNKEVKEEGIIFQPKSISVPFPKD